MKELTFFPLLESYPKTSGYGSRIDPITGTPGAFHGGVDYGAPWGAPVIAPWDGVVTTGYESGAGNWLWVDSGGHRFKSFHHDSFAVGSGEWVTAGRTIAYIDSTGSSTGSHAHFELWDYGIRIDPTGYLDRAPLYGGSPGTGDEDEMTDDDWNQMASLLNTMIVGKMAIHSSYSCLIEDDDGQYFITIDGTGCPRRYHPKSPYEANVLQVVGLLTDNKPEAPPAPCPSVFNARALPTEHRDALRSIPWAGDND